MDQLHADVVACIDRYRVAQQAERAIGREASFAASPDYEQAVDAIRGMRDSFREIDRHLATAIRVYVNATGAATGKRSASAVFAWGGSLWVAPRDETHVGWVEEFPLGEGVARQVVVGLDGLVGDRLHRAAGKLFDAAMGANQFLAKMAASGQAGWATGEPSGEDWGVTQSALSDALRDAGYWSAVPGKAVRS